MKIPCYSCNTFKEENEFPMDGRRVNGRSKWCLMCQNRALRESYKLDIAPPQTKPVLTEEELLHEQFLDSAVSFCTSCGREKTLRHFTRKAESENGYHSHCKECQAYRARMRRQVKAGKLTEDEMKTALAVFRRRMDEEKWAQWQAEADSDNQLAPR